MQGCHLCWVDPPAVTPHLPPPSSNPRPIAPAPKNDVDVISFPKVVCVQANSGLRAGAAQRGIYRSSRLGADLPKRPAESHIWGPGRLGDTTSRGRLTLARFPAANLNFRVEWLSTCVGGHSLLDQPTPYHGESCCATTCLTGPKRGSTLDIAKLAGREDHSS